MCGCISSNNNPANNAIDRDRRRLSVSKADDIKHMTKSDVRGSASGRGLILDQFPNARRKAYICGSTSEGQQKGFSDKCIEQSGEEIILGTSRVGWACKKGLKPESPNQDDFCIFRLDTIGIYGVFDGHGPYGHDISNFVQETLPKCLVQDPRFNSDPTEALKAAFPETHRLTVMEPHQLRLDCSLSGTTATMVVHREGTLYVAHVGDSRAVLARKKNGGYEVEDLTHDHKPSFERERQRILDAGGQVRRLEGDIPYRVFLKGKMYPGLSMTRSIGDTAGQKAGVSCDPDVTSRKVQKDWRFMLLCSDGIWEFINSQEAVEIVGKFAPSEAQKAAESLASEAWNRWIQEEGNVVDDITVIVTHFDED